MYPAGIMALSTNHQRFVAALLADSEFNQTRAYMRVYSNASRDTAGTESSKLMKNPEIAEAVEQGKKARLARLELTADDVLRDIALGVATDGGELAEHVVDCCRYCYGTNHNYQFTPAEFQRRLESYLANDAARKGGPKDPQGLLFIEKYGCSIGYDPRKPPVDTCPECFGRGEPRVLVRDTRFLTEAGRRQYAGVKMTKHGPEVQMRSRDKALEIAAKHTGVAKEHVKLETVRDLTDEQLAQRTAQLEHKLRGGKK